MRCLLLRCLLLRCNWSPCVACYCVACYCVAIGPLALPTAIWAELRTNCNARCLPTVFVVHIILHPDGMRGLGHDGQPGGQELSEVSRVKAGLSSKHNTNKDNPLFQALSAPPHTVTSHLMQQHPPPRVKQSYATPRQHMATGGDQGYKQGHVCVHVHIRHCTHTYT